jgi:hypothetical protein
VTRFDPAPAPIRAAPIVIGAPIHTTAETLYPVLKDSGKPFNNSFLHGFHSFALKIGWLAWTLARKSTICA